MRKIIFLILSLAVAGCENVDLDMHDQITFKAQEAPRKMNPAGSVPAFGKKIDYSEVDGTTLEAPFKLETDGKMGKEVYETFCSVCHSAKGVSDTPVAEKLSVTPFNLIEESTVELTDGELFVKIVASETVMSNYRNELTDKEAWEIVAYVRFLQKKR